MVTIKENLVISSHTCFSGKSGCNSVASSLLGYASVWRGILQLCNCSGHNAKWVQNKAHFKKVLATQLQWPCFRRRCTCQKEPPPPLFFSLKYAHCYSHYSLSLLQRSSFLTLNWVNVTFFTSVFFHQIQLHSSGRQADGAGVKLKVAALRPIKTETSSANRICRGIGC